MSHPSPDGYTHNETAVYAILKDVPVVLGKSCRGVKTVSLPYSYVPVADNVADLYTYDFSLERRVIEEAERAIQAAAAEKAALEERARREEAERKERERKKAPGLEDNILQPIPATGSPVGLRKEIASKSPSPTQPSATSESGGDKVNSASVGPVSTWKTKKNPHIDYLEFEHGLAPPDPWDTREEDDLQMLREVMGGSGPPASVPPQPQNTYSQPHQAPPSYSQLPATHPPAHAHTSLPASIISRAQAYLPESVASRVSHLHLGGFGRQPAGPPPPPPKPVGISEMYGNNSSGSMQYPSLSGGGASGSGYPRETGHQSGVPASVPPEYRDAFAGYLQMGFSRNAVERGMRLYGADEKKVLDFVISFEELHPTPRNSDAVEMAVTLFEHEQEKGRKFVDAFEALEELGFPRDRIKEALVLKGCDREAALEWLMRDGDG
ncbi:hypothetical protein HK104_008169 [Borealophlyctis nickersoniae]|nr:hypothetical protein HK104_008169 [Borealophlyctis nickersoniae]